MSSGPASFIDTHAHINDERLAINIEEVLRRADEAGVRSIMAIGTTASTSRECVALAERFPQVYAAVGIQPNYVHEAEAEDWDTIVELAAHPRVHAIGETGLDNYWKEAPMSLQQDYFLRHLALSRATKKPFIVHMRESGSEILEMLQAARLQGPLNGVMHSFTGDGELAQKFVKLGLYISFAGMVTYKKSSDLRDVAKSIPLDRLLLETDSPYLSPEPHRGRRPNEPAMLVHTARCLAEVCGIDYRSLAERTTANARQLFGIP